jgi:hypothetical protein
MRRATASINSGATEPTSILRIKQHGNFPIHEKSHENLWNQRWTQIPTDKTQDFLSAFICVYRRPNPIRPDPSALQSSSRAHSPPTTGPRAHFPHAAHPRRPWHHPCQPYGPASARHVPTLLIPVAWALFVQFGTRPESRLACTKPPNHAQPAQASPTPNKVAHIGMVQFTRRANP